MTFKMALALSLGSWAWSSPCVAGEGRAGRLNFALFIESQAAEDYRNRDWSDHNLGIGVGLKVDLNQLDQSERAALNLLVPTFAQITRADILREPDWLLAVTGRASQRASMLRLKMTKILFDRFNYLDNQPRTGEGPDEGNVMPIAATIRNAFADSFSRPLQIVVIEDPRLEHALKLQFGEHPLIGPTQIFSISATSPCESYLTLALRRYPIPIAEAAH